MTVGATDDPIRGLADVDSASASATGEAPAQRLVDERSAMKAIVAVVVIPSENRAEGLVRPVYRGDGRGDSRDAPLRTTPLRWGTRRRKTARPGPSPASEWMLSGSRDSHEHQELENGNHPVLQAQAGQRAERRLSSRSGFQIVSIPPPAPVPPN